MIDIKFVIKGLEDAKEVIRKSELTGGKKVRLLDACCNAVTLLKEQEAVKPECDKKTGRVWLCGNCGSYVGFEDHDENDPNEFDKFCRECGHPVLWEGR